MSELKKRMMQGLWTQNQALVALLGLCPLLAVSHSLVNALALGFATTAAMVVSGGAISLTRRWMMAQIRLPLFVLILASIVTAIDLIMQAWFYELHRTLGLFIPLIVTNCAIMGRAELYASRNPLPAALLDGLFMGLGFTAVLMLLGGIREVIGTGRLLQGADQLFGPVAADWGLQISLDYPGFLLALLPPGAFIGLGGVLALKNWIDSLKKDGVANASEKPLVFKPSSHPSRSHS